ncbi:Synaptotagmin-like protein 3 [Lonchura striata]|uniref:Synaptotagmin-like protein 3 n=1 Tax=Lonchura striata TaxID=40157 RepID=A0A218UFG1_9PASE|nr:Synaptotagmin-like protein 3 [Lonchura striata domestica]
MACEFNLNFLKELEREAVLEVLYRDQMVRKTEEERIRYCSKWILRTGQRYCEYDKDDHSKAQEQLDVKVKAGEWFFEERAKKYPGEGRHETVGAKLLESYQKLSKISVVPPTPPPFTESAAGANVMGNICNHGNFKITNILCFLTHCISHLQELGESKRFNKSVENLFLSLTTHIKRLLAKFVIVTYLFILSSEISKSQNDMADRCALTTDYGKNVERRKQRRSQSDTAINITSRVFMAFFLNGKKKYFLNFLQIKSTPSLQHLIAGAQNDSETQSKSHCKEEEGITTSPTSDAVFCDGRKYGSLYSLSSTCTESGNFGKANITGEIEFALKYNFRACILEICIKGCKNLAYGEEKKKKCNPYVKVYLLPDKSPWSKRKTAVKKGTVDPEFDETLKYKIEHSQLRSRQLQISVWHAGALKYRVFLGEVVIPLAAWNFEEDSMQFDWYPLKPKLEKPEDDLIQYSAELLVSTRLSVPAQYQNLQFEGIKCFGIHECLTVVLNDLRGNKDQGVLNCQLQVMLFGAKNLPMLRSAGMLNSFVKGSSDQFLGGAKLGASQYGF